MSLNPEKKQVLAVVGVGPGIGEAVARKFAAENFVVALIARTQQKLQRIQEAINADHPNSAKYYITDASNGENLTSTFIAIKTELGPVNVLVYNAGLRRMAPRTILETSSEEFESFTKINMFGAFWASKAVLPDMMEDGKGTILFTGATGSLRGSSGMSSFSPGKFGLRSLCQIIARESQAKGIHAVHVIVDGPVGSDIVGDLVKRHWEKEGETEKLAEPEAYLMQPKDVANVYWDLHTQPRSTWTHELDVRAQMESMFSRL